MTEPLTWKDAIFVAHVGWKDDEPGLPEIYRRHEGESWADAKRWLLEQLRGFLTDECESCRKHGTEEFARLEASDGPTWAGEVDGDDYWIEAIIPLVNGSVNRIEL